MKEYTVLLVKEGLLGSLIFGQSKVDPVKFAGTLNQYAKQGWEVKTMEKDQRRKWLFFKIETYVVIMERTIPEKEPVERIYPSQLR
jgi:hypothetical protein